jgi:RNA polymerase sigma factor (sigma-70 family)
MRRRRIAASVTASCVPEGKSRASRAATDRTCRGSTGWRVAEERPTGSRASATAEITVGCPRVAQATWRRSGRGSTLRLLTRREAADEPIRLRLPDDSPGAGADTPRNGSNGSARSGGGEERTDPRDDPDVERMLRVRAGDDDAFQELFLKHGEPLLNLAYRFVGSRARAEEIVQEAFLRIYRASSRYEPRARFRTYASRVVINLSLNELRRVEHQLVVDPEAGSPPTSTHPGNMPTRVPSAARGRSSPATSTGGSRRRSKSFPARRKPRYFSPGSTVTRIARLQKSSTRRTTP